MLQNAYSIYCAAFHEVAAQYENFPFVNIADLSDVLYAFGIYSREKSK